jgi:outer membrane lipoprotein-sorting protein
MGIMRTHMLIPRTRFTVGLLALALAVAVARPAAQTPAPTIDQILDKFLTALGGRAAVEKVTSFTAKGTIEIVDAGLTGTYEQYQKAPNKSAIVINLDGMGIQRDAFDGTMAWAEDPQNGIREKSGQELIDSKRSAIFPREVKLKTIYPTMTIKGHETVGGKDTYLVEATPADGAPVRFYFDVESGLLVRQIAMRITAMGLVQVDTTYDDFRAVDGVKRAFMIRQVTPLYTAVVRLNEIKHNMPVDDATFKKPGL